VHFTDRQELKYLSISYKFPFPNLTGLNADNGIKKQIKSYICLLFIRQYTIIPYLITIKPFELPSLPTKSKDLKEWRIAINDFVTIVEEMLREEKILRDLEIDHITEDWCRDKNVLSPNELLKELHRHISG
jgi:hypothetical protein